MVTRETTHTTPNSDTYARAIGKTVARAEEFAHTGKEKARTHGRGEEGVGDGNMHGNQAGPAGVRKGSQESTQKTDEGGCYVSSIACGAADGQPCAAHHVPVARKPAIPTTCFALKASIRLFAWGVQCH